MKMSTPGSAEVQLNVKKEIFSDVETSVTFVTVTSLLRLLTLKINALIPEMVNVNPNPLYVYAQSFGTTVFVLGSFTLFFYVRNEMLILEAPTFTKN